MPERRAEPPVVYMYLDSDGIERLYAQTVDKVVQEWTETSQKVGGAKAKGRLGLGNLLAAILGLDASVEGEVSRVQTRAVEEKGRLSVEQKLKRLLEYLQQPEEKHYFEDLFRAAKYCKQNYMAPLYVPGVYIRVRTEFNAPQFYLVEGEVRGGVHAVNMSKHVQFELGPSHTEYSDDHFKKNEFRFVMPAGLKNFTRIYEGEMPAGGHDDILLGFGRGVSLGVFGYLRKIRIEYQIKPFAIWL